MWLPCDELRDVYVVLVFALSTHIQDFFRLSSSYLRISHFLIEILGETIQTIHGSCLFPLISKDIVEKRLWNSFPPCLTPGSCEECVRFFEVKRNFLLEKERKGYRKGGRERERGKKNWLNWFWNRKHDKGHCFGKVHKNLIYSIDIYCKLLHSRAFVILSLSFLSSSCFSLCLLSFLYGSLRNITLFFFPRSSRKSES